MLRYPVASLWLLALPFVTLAIAPSDRCITSHGKASSSPDTLMTEGEFSLPLDTIDQTRADARLDSAFGLALYAISIVEELGFHRIQVRIVGRLALRALVEANITLRYLAQKDDESLWKSYRVYGAGQAKLAFLKAQEIEGDLPPFIDESALHEIANEDIWQEFLDIDIGHWANSNLRKLAMECGAKDLYDKYYDWASTYTHSHWGAIRDTNFITCHNPLHRLPRIPRVDHGALIL